MLGTMPVRGWFPFVAVEDTTAGVCWGAPLAWAGYWQMEVALVCEPTSVAVVRSERAADCTIESAGPVFDDAEMRPLAGRRPAATQPSR